MPRKGPTPLKIKKTFVYDVKVRQSWNKYNLYNLARQTAYRGNSHNFFKQKWMSKSMTRNYHGEHIREKQWLRMFDRRLRSVIPMDAEYLASQDGRVESAGRGSGAEKRKGGKGTKMVPYMQMMFAPMERRLDTAVFRAMFASSARQARQFVVHGAVKVNGKKMRYPGYLLNPGDMFQVEPERVMFATGAPKITAEAAAESGEAEDESSEPTPTPEPEAVEEEVEDTREPREILKDLRAQAKSILTTSKRDIGAKRKQDLRAFSKSIKRLLSKSTNSTIMTDSLEAQLLEIQNQLNASRERKEGKTPTSPEKDAAETTETDTPESQPPAVKEQQIVFSDAEYNDLNQALLSMSENPVDDAKPYATPWMPKDYMSAFAFIPRFLEVNHNICAAVYLRHPVARPGLAEVPSPYPHDVQGTAFTWYLRRR